MVIIVFQQYQIGCPEHTALSRTNLFGINDGNDHHEVKNRTKNEIARTFKKKKNGRRRVEFRLACCFVRGLSWDVENLAIKWFDRRMPA